MEHAPALNTALKTPNWTGELRATLLLAAPLALANMLQMLTYAVDVIFIARLGEAELAASSLVMALFGLIVWALSALTAAVAPLIAADLGERPNAIRPVRRSMRMALWLAVFSGALGMALSMVTIPVMHATGQPAEVIVLAGPYLLALVWSLIPMVVGNVLRTYVSTLGRPIFATAITAVGIGVNALGNYALIFGNWGAPRLELLGAGLATIITTTSTMLAYVAVIRLDRRLHRYRIFGRWWRPDWDRFGQIVRIGTPIALTVLAEAGIFGAAAFLMGRFGASELAGHTIALNIAAFAFQVPFGVGQAVTIRVGYFYGARDPQGIKQAGWVAIAIGTGFMALTAIAMILTPYLLLSIYLDPKATANAALVGFALQYLVWAAAFQLVDGLQAVSLGALRGLQDTRVPMWIAVFSYWVPGFGLAIGLGFFTILEGTGVWIGLATGLTFAAALLTWRWWRREALGLTRRSTGQANPVAQPQEMIRPQPPAV
ncbi:MAG: MATE family efflux transporter [Erythrobacter sp.]|uniref:MATE family efflux transporter n=1 Tax=Erythrobacter sp. TaxID=1042 RepID=UPI0026077EC6|nr:MATE family efflux transporter [Erythrobacter sp.]MDJ0979433.1 MATE family efflux transporter [Erythrobacter sp.]